LIAKSQLNDFLFFNIYIVILKYFKFNSPVID